jgi:ABC-type glutathione transport system ATPase component
MMFNKAIERFKIPPWKNPEDMDDDVREESEKIQMMTDDELRKGNLVLKGISKYYGTHLAVNQLNLRVNEKECFGLLGELNFVF